MFIRAKKQSNDKVSILIVECRRVSGKVRQKVLRTVATVYCHEEEEFRKLAAHIMVEMQTVREPNLFTAHTLVSTLAASRNRSVNDTSPLPVNLRALREEARIISGIHDVYGSLYDGIGFSKVFKECPVSRRVLKDIVMARLARPCSKRSSCELLERDFGISYPLEKIYRMMDTLTPGRIGRLQDIAWHHSRGLLDEEIHLLFYDCTTLYFESFTEDELRSFGYSKDHKFNQGQVLLALMVTREGLPVGYEVFPGNMYEGDTFCQAVEKLRKRYKIKRAVVVADSGLLSRQNIEMLEAKGYEFILGARLRNLSDKWKDKILDNKDYHKTEKDDEVVRTTDFPYSASRRLIVSHSTKRAEKDRKDREKAIDNLRQKLEKSNNPKSLVSNFGYKKYLSLEGEISVRVNEDKLQKEALWDGLHGVFSNIKASDMKPEEILSQYHGLWQVEESFRIEKHDLRIRPVFHWSAKRIRAHLAICFVAFALVRFLQHRIKKEAGKSISAERIRNELCRIQDSIVCDTANNIKYVIPSKPSKDAIKIYQAIGKKRHQIPFRIFEDA